MDNHSYASDRQPATDTDFSDFDHKATEAVQVWAAHHPHPFVPILAFAAAPNRDMSDKALSPHDLAQAVKYRTEDGVSYLEMMHSLIRIMGPGSDERLLYLLTRKS